MSCLETAALTLGAVTICDFREAACILAEIVSFASEQKNAVYLELGRTPSDANGKSSVISPQFTRHNSVSVEIHSASAIVQLAFTQTLINLKSCGLWVNPIAKNMLACYWVEEVKPIPAILVFYGQLSSRNTHKSLCSVPCGAVDLRTTR